MDPTKLRLKLSLTVFVAVMVFGTLGFVFVEGRSLMDALYFNIVTLATVGYGDIHPVTLWGKVLSILIIVLGVGTFLGVVASTTELVMEKKIKRARLEKMNMVIGVFFSEVGTRLLSIFAGCDPGVAAISARLSIDGAWIHSDFLQAGRALKAYEHRLEIEKADLEELRRFLAGKRDMLVNLLENPVLLEHEAFTDLLRAVFHLIEELAYRDDLKSSPEPDLRHLGGDMARVYRLLAGQWLAYMRYLKDNYPYLFSLAARTNPFRPDASPVVTS